MRRYDLLAKKNQLVLLSRLAQFGVEIGVTNTGIIPRDPAPKAAVCPISNGLRHVHANVV
jgi:hypothetical protein